MTQPNYSRLAQTLRNAIMKGEMKVGEKLPAERRLCDIHGVSRITVRQALDILEEERLVRRLQGSGTFIAANPTRRIPLMIDYTGTMRKHAPKLRRRVAAWRRAAAPQWAGAELRMDGTKTILYAERVDTLEGIPVACDQAYIPNAFGSRLAKRNLQHVDFIEEWTRTEGFEIASCSQSIEAVPAPATTARHLKMPRGRPVLKSTETYFSRTGEPAGLYVSFYNPDYVSVSSQFAWPSRPRARPNRRGKQKCQTPR